MFPLNTLANNLNPIAAKLCLLFMLYLAEIIWQN